MKLLVSFVLLLTTVPVFATDRACPNDMSQTYLTPGFVCRQGPLTFSNFTFSAAVEGEAQPLSPLDVAIGPPSSEWGKYGFDAVGNFFAGDPNSPCGDPPIPGCPEFGEPVTPGGRQITTISYTVKGPVTSVTISLPGWGLYGREGGGAQPIGWDLYATFRCPGKKNCLPTLYSGAFLSPSYSQPATATCSPVCTSFTITETLTVYAGWGSDASANGFETYFTAAPAAIAQPNP